MNKILLTAAAMACAGGLQAQDPLSADAKFWYSSIKAYVIRAAEKMPEANYSFKPAPEVRAFGQIVGHIADDEYFFCGSIKGQPKESAIEKSVTSKAELVSELKKAFAYCDAVYDGFKDSEAAEKIKTFAGERTKLNWLDFNTAHMYEHYGNIVTYMRIKGIVPPSSEKGH